MRAVWYVHWQHLLGSPAYDGRHAETRPQSAGIRQAFALSMAAFFTQEQMTDRPDVLREEGLEMFRVFGRLREARV